MTTKFIARGLALAAALGLLTACGNNETKNKLLQGSLTTTTGGTTTTTTTASTPAGQSADAAQTAGSVLRVMGGRSGSALSPRSASPQVPQGMTYDAATGFYTMTATDPQMGAGTFKMRFQDASGNALAVMGTDNNNPQEQPDFTLFTQVKTMRFVMSGTDPAGNTFNSDMTASFSGFDRNADQTMSGTMSMSGPNGSFSMTMTNVVMDGSTGQPKGGSMSGTGTLPDGTTMSMAMTINSNGSMDGTVTINSTQTVTVHINADGSGTYTDETGTHAIA